MSNINIFLKNMFNKYEKEELKNKLAEIKDEEIAKKVKIAQSAINFMTAFITSSAITTVN